MADRHDKLDPAACRAFAKRTRAAGLPLQADTITALADALEAARTTVATAVYVDEGWWHPNVKDGRVHDHAPEGSGYPAYHRECEPVYTKRIVR